MSRLIDADELLKHKTDHEYISTHLIYNAPTVDAIPTQAVRDAIAEIEFERDRKLGGEAFEAIQYKTYLNALEIICKHTKVGDTDGN